MKKCVLLAGLLGIGWFLFHRSTPSSSLPTLQPTQLSKFPQPSPTRGLSYYADGQSFRVLSFSVKNPEKLLLIPNFSQKALSLSIARTNQCATLTSGAFYSTDDTPIGLFLAGGKQLGAYQQNAFFNGFFSVNVSGNATIGSQLPDDNVRFGIQSGPILMTDGVIKKLTIRDDQPARRILVAQTNDNTVVFLALFGNENLFDGPKLTDVPKHLKEIEKNLGILLTNAINLDGGSASAFITNDTSLTELTPVGSFFCALDN